MSISRWLRRFFHGSHRKTPITNKRLQLEALEDRVVPTLAGDQVFPLDNPWNQRIDNAPVAANSSTLVAAIGASNVLHPDFGSGTYAGSIIGIPVNIVDSTQPKISVVIDAWPSESDIVPAPIPSNAVIEGDPVATSQNGSDKHLLVYDKDSNILYEFFNTTRPADNADGKWHASNEAVWHLDQDYFRPTGWTSADAAGLPIVPGLVRAEEVLDQGVINHALRFTVPSSYQSFVFPATHAAGGTDATKPRMGERFRLKANVDISKFSPANQVILKALKEYGMIVADNGGGWFVSGEPSSRWNNDDLHNLVNVLGNNFEVVDLTPRVSSLSSTTANAGNTITINGLNFSGGAGTTKIYFGTVAVSQFSLNGDSSLTVTVPAGTAGSTVDVTVKSGYGTSAKVTGDKFTYGSTVSMPGQFQFSTSGFSCTEGCGSLTITVNRVNGSNGPVTVNYATSNSTATAGSDYTAKSGSLSFADGQTSVTFSVPVTDDTLVEGSENLNLTLSNPTGGATLGSAISAMTILDNDGSAAGIFQFSAPSYTVSEGVGNAVITVTRTSGSSGAATINYATADGTANTVSDYTATSGTLSFADGQSSATFAIPIRDDIMLEPTETINLTLSNPTGGASLGSPTAILNIQENDAIGNFQYSLPTYNINESGGQATITVNRTGGVSGTVTLQYATSNGTATAGSDYTTTSGTLTFYAGETTHTFTIPILDDTLAEGTETVNLTLSNITGGGTLGTPINATLSIVDNDSTSIPSSVLQFSAATYTVNENGGQATITVNRTGDLTGTASVQYATSNGTTTAGSDYTAATGTLTFAAGQATATFTIPILDDTLVEGTETVNLTLSNSTGGATLGTQTSAALNILDNDTATVPDPIQFSSSSYTVSEGVGNATVTVTRTGDISSAATVDYATSDGTVVTVEDYTATSGTLSFAAGQASATFTIPIRDDILLESTETINLTLSNPTGGATLGSATAVLNIQDNDAIGNFQFSTSSYSVNENGGQATITVIRTGGVSGTVTLQYATSNGTATAGSDYTAASGTFTFYAGETTKTFTVPILDDILAEGTETVNLTLSNITGGGTLGTPATTTLNILDNDTALPGQFQFSSPTYTVSEGVGYATITVTRTNGCSGAVTVGYATSNGTAVTVEDYTATSGTLSFAAGQTSATFKIPIRNDILLEPTQTVNLTLKNPTGGATLGSATAVLNIQDNDAIGNFQFSSPTYSVNENCGQATITVVRTGGVSGTVTLQYATANGTAIAGQDYTAKTGTLTFYAGQTMKTFTVPITNDTLAEPTETIKLTLSNITGGGTFGTQTTAVLSIVDNDTTTALAAPATAIASPMDTSDISNYPGQFAFSSTSYSVGEGDGFARITVNRVDGTKGNVTVKYYTLDGTALQPYDYAKTTGTLTFADGETSKTFLIPVMNDKYVEANETVKVYLSTPTGGATLATPHSAILTIVNDDGTAANSTTSVSPANPNGVISYVTFDANDTNAANWAWIAQFVTLHSARYNITWNV